MTATRTVDREEALSALHAIPPDLPRETWHKAGRGAIAAGATVDDLVEWSRPAKNFKSEQDVRAAFRNITPEGGTGPATLFGMARDHGWSADGEGLQCDTTAILADLANRTHQKSATRSVSENKRQRLCADDLWNRFEPATGTQPYVTAKGGVPDGLRVVPDGDPFVIMHQSMVGSLVIPMRRADGTLASLQFIPPPATAKRLIDRNRPTKLNLPGATMDGWFVVGELTEGRTTYVCEGIGQAWACWKATGDAAAVTFGSGRTRKVAEELRRTNPTARLVIVPDAGKESEAYAIALNLGATVAQMPDGAKENEDLNDLMLAEGLDKVRQMLVKVETSRAPLPLQTIFADELPREYQPPNEIVQGLLTAGGCSMVFGDSNSGKTFLCIDLACALARGVPWMGRQTEAGLVVYLAVESPASVRSRLQAYQYRHNCVVPNFAVVQAPVNLFSSDADTDVLIGLVRQVERERNQKVRLIVGDTVARLSAGANENSGEDMGLVVQRIDRIRTACDTHFLSIHHSGKNAANGARGWSGIRAAMDTEIEVTHEARGRSAEVTKQRDLGGKGDRIGFQLEIVKIGTNKWGEPATTCVVVPAEPPAKGGRGSKITASEGAVVEYMRSLPGGTYRSKVVNHFKGHYTRSTVYRAMEKLTALGMLVAAENSGMVAIAEAVR